MSFGGHCTSQRSNVGFLTLVLWCGGRVLKKRVLQPIVGRAALGGDFSCSFAGGDRVLCGGRGGFPCRCRSFYVLVILLPRAGCGGATCCFCRWSWWFSVTGSNASGGCYRMLFKLRWFI